MFKKLLFCILALGLFSSCDYKVQKCIYEVYQKGELLPVNYIHYKYRLGERCADFTKDGNVYKLINIELVDYGTVKH